MAKEQPDDILPQRESQVVVFKDQKCIVKKVHISGLERTKADFVVDDLKPVLNAKSVITAYQQAIECRTRLMSKGIFEKVEIVMDTTSQYDDKKLACNGIQVLFRAHERKNITGGLSTEMSTTDQPEWVMRILSPNVFGRGETLSSSFSRKLGSESVASHSFYSPSDFNFSASKPFISGSLLRISILKDQLECPWNSSTQIVRGSEVEYQFPLLGNLHSLSWHGHWRELSSLNKTTSFAVREDFGHSIKSSIIHSMKMDRTDDPILPKKGSLFKMTEELAGLGGDVKLLKESIEAQYHKTLFNYVTLSVGLRFGFTVPLDDRESQIPERFFIGGPLSLRGFDMNCAGPQTDGDFTGGNNYFVTGIHAYFPLPFFWKQSTSGSWLDGFRLHAFANAGNVSAFLRDSPIRPQLSRLAEGIRASYGVGLVYNFMRRARLELNFCMPCLVQVGDRTSDGIQFGIGVTSI